MFISNLTSREKAEITEKALIALGELIILDATGHLVYISKEYAQNMHISMEDSIGRHILEVIPDSKLPEVLKTGQSILGAMYYRDNNAFWVNRIPIKRKRQNCRRRCPIYAHQRFIFGKNQKTAQCRHP